MKQEEAIKYLRQLYPHGGSTWLDEKRIDAITMAVNALEKTEPALKHFSTEELKAEIKRRAEIKRT